MLAVLFLNRMAMKRRISRRQSLSKPVKAVKVEVEVELKAPEVVCCRTCLSTEDLESIFVSENNEQKRSDELKLVTGLEIKVGDGLSQKICNKCIERITEALKFRRTCRKAEKTLLGKKESGRKTKKKPKLQKKGSKTTKTKKNEDIFDDDYVFDGADDFHNDNYKEDDYFDDKNLQNETCENDASYDTIRQKENKIKSKPPGRKKRQVLPNAPPYKCNTCNKEFQMKATFKAHTRFHTNFCVCETCGKRCRNNNQLQEHKRARHGLGRIHKCAYCEYSSATKEALTIHERRHTGERPYVCDHCGATFHRRSNLVQHIAIHLPEKNFQCDMCPKRLKSRKFLQIHKHNAHTGKRYGYLCSVCDHRFEKPNKCTICNKREKSKKLLKLHESKVHRPKKYKYLCPVCQDVFTRPGNVRQHLTRSHGVGRAQQGAIEKIEFQIHTSILAEKRSLVDFGHT